MKGNSGHVQTVSIIDTISELAGGGAGGGGGGQVGRRLGGGGGGGGVRPRLGRSQSPGAPPSNPLSLQRAPPPPLPRLPRMAGLLGAATSSSGHLTTSISVNSLHSLPSYSFSDLRNAPAPPQRTGLLAEHSGERKKRRGRRGRQQGGSRGHSETPDWIRELFLWARKGDLERLVRFPFTFIPHSFHKLDTVSLVCKKEKFWKKQRICC